MTQVESHNITTYNPTITLRNPLDRALSSFQFHQEYIQLMNPRFTKVLFLGLNPGPHGMGKTGVPFGDPVSVRKFLKMDVPEDRSEVSGRRFWGLMEEICGNREQFFKNCFVQNLCPVFYTKGKRNTTPFESAIGSLETRRKIMKLCDGSLKKVLEQLRPVIVVAIGRKAEERAKDVCAKCQDSSLVTNIRIVQIPHPSRANPRFPKDSDWRAVVRRILRDQRVEDIMQS